jgi:hypothetical protein
MYVFKLAEYIHPERGYEGSDLVTCDWEGQTYTAVSRRGATMALARTLCAAGAPDGPWVGVGARDGKKRLHGRSLSALSTLTIRESATRGPELVKWTPYPGRPGVEDTDYEPAEGPAEAP